MYPAVIERLLCACERGLLRVPCAGPLFPRGLPGLGPECEKTVDVKKSKSCEADVSSDLRKEVENHYKLSLPEDFYHFWKFCEELDPEKPAGILLMNLLYMLVQMKQRKTV